jgi:hypothetical protein
MKKMTDAPIPAPSGDTAETFFNWNVKLRFFLTDLIRRFIFTTASNDEK